MGAIQNSVNNALGTITAGIGLAKHVGAQEEQLKQQKEADIAKATNLMSEAALKGSGFKQEEVDAYLAANTLGMKPTADYQPRYDIMRETVSNQVLQSETYAKMLQNNAFRQRLLDLGSTQEGRERLAKAVSPMEDKK